MADAVPYEKTRRPITAETRVDLLVFRPAGRALAELALATPIRSGWVTALAAFVGLAGASLFRFTARFNVIVGAALLLLYALLSLTAVELDRARGASSRLGRILGGIVEYAVGIAASVAIAVHLTAEGDGGAVLLTLFGMGSVAVQVTLFDHFESRYLAYSDAEPPEESDLAETQTTIGVLAREGESGAALLLLRAHALYLQLQRLLGGPARPPPRTAVKARAYAESLLPIARGWAWLGSSTHLVLLILAACLGSFSAYLWIRLTVFNAAMIALWIEQQRRERAVLTEAQA